MPGWPSSGELADRRRTSECADRRKTSPVGRASSLRANEERLGVEQDGRRQQPRPARCARHIGAHQAPGNLGHLGLAQFLELAEGRREIAGAVARQRGEVGCRQSRIGVLAGHRAGRGQRDGQSGSRTPAAWNHAPTISATPIDSQREVELSPAWEMTVISARRKSGRKPTICLPLGRSHTGTRVFSGRYRFCLQPQHRAWRLHDD